MKLTLVLLLCTLAWSPSSSFSTAPKTFARIPSHSPNTRRCIFQKQLRTASASTTSLNYGELRGVDAQLVFDTWEWCSNLGAPAALVAGAVLATMADSRQDLAPKRSDRKLLRLAKKATRFLLLTSFGLEIVSIFVTTVTGTMILSHGDIIGTLANFSFNSPLGFMMNNWEFEYLTSRICFLQGLFHWLASVALEQLIPKEGEGLAARRMNKFTFSALMTLMVFMLSFLNRHIKFYANYFIMWKRLVALVVESFIWPLQPLTIVMVPMMLGTLYYAYEAFKTPSEEEEDAYEAEHGIIAE
ncbi:hypothetical protein MHU86_23520 [Fragilaria crotonensis]|nr:hypothetical protein MHU86_23520 [Fragilaria crotonensis]